MSELLRTLAWYVERLGLSTYRRQLVFYFRPPAAQAPAPTILPGAEIRFVRSEELEKLGYPGGWLPLPEARRWLEGGDSDCLAVIIDGKIAAYMWAERRIARIDYLRLRIPLPAGHVYYSKVLVTPEHRRRGLARSMYQFLAHFEPGLAAHSACVVENLPMHRLFLGSGWQPSGQLDIYKLGPLKIYRLERARQGRPRRAFHTRLGPEDLFL
jgi:GNAT superfamily N-acetyltransferase